MVLYKKVVSDRLYEIIVNEIERLIVAGELKPGDSLPPERELAERFGVSRTAVREAIKVLAQKQLVLVQRGRGAVIAHPSLSLISDSLNLFLKLEKASAQQLIEVRFGLEPEIASLAAARATPEQIAELERIVIAHDAAFPDAEVAAPLDVSFHTALCDAAQNAVAKALLVSIQDLLYESILASYHSANGNGTGVSELPRDARTHMHIVDAIRARDGHLARQHMRDHLTQVANRQGVSLDLDT